MDLTLLDQILSWYRNMHSRYIPTSPHPHKRSLSSAKLIRKKKPGVAQRSFRDRGAQNLCSEETALRPLDDLLVD